MRFSRVKLRGRMNSCPFFLLDRLAVQIFKGFDIVEALESSGPRCSVETLHPKSDQRAGRFFLGVSGLHGKAGSKRSTSNGGKPGVGAGKRAPGRSAAPAEKPLKLDAAGLVVMRPGWREAIERTVTGLHFELVDVERVARGLLRVTIDRIPGHAYPVESEFVIVEDCELVTRQLQYSLEVDGVDYARLEVSSPGLDRPLKREADYVRFLGQAISVTLKLPFEGRKVFKGVLGKGESEGWTLVFSAGKTEQVLGFTLDEVREARLVPVLDFKGRRSSKPADAPAAEGAAALGDMPSAAPGVNGG
jgi:ribosome maturation factor RimP